VGRRAGPGIRACERARRYGRREQAGAVSSQLVITTPALLLLILMVFQFGVWQHAQHVSETAAQEGMAAARVEGGNQAAGAARAQIVAARLGGSVIVNPQVTVTRTADQARVEVTGTAEPVVPLLSLPVHAVAQAPTERFRAGSLP
jgi:Flp pilus assembly protein TadG